MLLKAERFVGSVSLCLSYVVGAAVVSYSC